jgi:hypothetical protein
MKFVLFLLIPFAAFSQDFLSTKEIKEKMERIRIELEKRKPLPPPFEQVVFSGNEHDTTAWLPFFYKTTRTDGNKIDSLRMQVSVIKKENAFEHMDFYETFNSEHIGMGKVIFYRVNKEGELTKAWYVDAYSALNPTTPTIKEIDLLPDSTGPFIRPDARTLAKYKARLKVTLDELEGILFKK